MRQRRAFTLIEVLVVVSIIALLLAIMMPSLKEVRRLSRRTVCQKNLEQIGVGMQAYLLNNTPKDTFPYACRLPSWERQNAQQQNKRPLPPLSEVLRTELRTNKTIRAQDDEAVKANQVFACPADENKLAVAGVGDPPLGAEEAIPTRRYFDHEGTSYEWESNLNGTRLDFKLVRIYGQVGLDNGKTRRFEIAKVPRNNMWMLFDFEAFHGGPNMRGSHNILYTDMHVESDKWDSGKKVGEAMP